MNSTSDEGKSKSSILIIVAIIGASATCIAAIIGQGEPISSRLVEYWLPAPTPTVETTQEQAAQPPTLIEPTPTSEQTLSTLPSEIPTTIPAQATQIALCQWLKDNFPQTLDEVKARFNLPGSATNTFSLVTEICPGVANGFIIRDATIEFCLEAPPGGCIDSWSGDTRYEGDVGTPVPDGFGGWRASEGVVCTRGMTYRVANCTLP